jgi:hypothetical protein
MTRVFCSPSPKRVSDAQKKGEVAVLLYGVGSAALAGVGHPIVEECRQLTRPPSKRAWDFLSFALGVTAADSFVKRSEAADGWTREIDITVELIEPAPWQAISDRIENTLRFLTGDIWRVSFAGRGAPLPTMKTTRWKDSGCDCVSLFSGGLDSFIGAIDLIAEGREPYLASCAYPKDGEKQDFLVRELGIKKNRHFPVNPDPRWDHENETSMRARSFLFLALGVLIASTLKRSDEKAVDVFVPENGFISLNVPLTSRRLGSLSTRTTHPHFIAGVEQILGAVGLNVTLCNPYQYKTKGQMIAGCKNAAVLRKLLNATVSCGKWKRKSQQCGRCLPCLIRRAAFSAAKVPDQTDYRFANLSDVDDPEDILAVRVACLRLRGSPEKSIRRSGPLPENVELRAQLASVFHRGLTEVENFLSKALP